MGGEEITLPTWEHFASDDPLHARAVEQMLVGVATRGYGRSLEPLGADVKARGTSKSAVSRRFVAATAERAAEQLSHPIGERPPDTPRDPPLCDHELLSKKRVLRDQFDSTANAICGQPGNESKKVDHMSSLTPSTRGWNL